VSPAFAYQKGDSIDSSILQTLSIDPDKVTVVNFFASWCASCKKEIPLLNKMDIDSSEVELLGVCTDKKLSKGKAFQEKLNVQYRVYDDTSQDVVAAFAPFGMPAIYFIKGGVVKQLRFGAIPKIDQHVETEINQLLAE
jgi:thiol-disulfide isomerase/thioredoxin